MALERIEKLNTKIIILLAVVIITYCVVFPFSVPITISARTRHMYQLISEVPDGSTILVNDESGPSVWRTPDQYPNVIAVMYQLLRKNCKFIFFSSMMPDNSQLFIDMEIKSGDFPIAATPGKVYGIDWVIVGWVAGMEAGLAEFGKDLKAAKVIDWLGNSLYDMPLMKNIKSAADFDLLLIASGTLGDTEGVFRQIQTPYKLKTVVCTGTSTQPSYMAYVSSGQVQEVIYGPQIAAEYETLIGRPGVGLATVSSTTTMVAYSIVVFFIIGNIPIFARMRWRKVGLPEKAKE